MKQIYILTLIAFFSISAENLKAQTIWTGADLTFTKTGGSNWTLEANQDRLTNNVWITRQNSKPIYNFKWWQDNFSQDPSNSDIEADFWNNSTILSFTPTGGTKRVKWALLDDTGSSVDWSGYNYGSLGNPANFHSFNNIIQIIEILEEDTGDFSTISVLDDFTVSFNGTDFSSPDIGDYIVGKKFGIWLVDDDIYLTLTFNSWGSGGSGGGFSYTRSTDQSLSTSEFELKENIKLFPNPSIEYIQILGLTGNERYILCDILGTEIKKGFISNNEQIDIRNFTNGLYFLKFDNGNTIKFIKE